MRQIRRSAGRRSVAVTTWASFASMWLIPRLEDFQSANPDIDIRIDATDSRVDLETSDVDLALRYTTDAQAPRRGAAFGDQLTPVASPWLLKSGPPLRSGADLARHALIEAGDSHRTQNLEWLTWRRWLEAQGLARMEPKRWLYLDFAHQIAQAALSTGQGVALARLPLVADSLASGDLIEVLPEHRMGSPMAYFLVVAPRSADRAETLAFCRWLMAQAQKTREVMGEPA